MHYCYRFAFSVSSFRENDFISAMCFFPERCGKPNCEPSYLSMFCTLVLFFLDSAVRFSAVVSSSNKYREPLKMKKEMGAQ